PGSVVAGPAKRREYWVRQAAGILSLPSGVVAEPAKRRGYWGRQAAWLPGPLSGVVAGSIKWWVCGVLSRLFSHKNAAMRGVFSMRCAPSGMEPALALLSLFLL
ncbi:hypothetical protein HMPREF9080_02296, partial [Cardiobacterium valvarum F0432]